MSAINWLFAGLGLVAFLAAVYFVLPHYVQSVLRVLLWPRYKIVRSGLEHLPKTGPVLLVVNHIAWIDGFILAAACPRRGRPMVNASIVNRPIIGPMARRAGVVPVPFTGPRALRAAINSTRTALDEGGVVGLFPEGQLTRNGCLGPFYRGIEVILEGREHIPVIPVYIDNLWGSIFSFSGGRFYKKWPEGLRRQVNVVFGPPIKPPVSAVGARQALLATGVTAYEMRRPPIRPLETLDPGLPNYVDPTLGPLTGSTANYECNDIRQVGHKPGTVGQALPGVALRIVDDAGIERAPATEGRLEALVAGRPGWTDTGRRGQLDKDGFVTLVGGEEGESRSA